MIVTAVPKAQKSSLKEETCKDYVRLAMAGIWFVVYLP
jgi:hypothetical protein